MHFVLCIWDVYTNSHKIRLLRFWQDAFEAAYQELTRDVTEVRDAAINKIAKMSVHSIHFDPPPVQSMGIGCAYVGGAFEDFEEQLLLLKVCRE
ncbi:hypothetical protein E2542_SST09115 [Spatholobus suberectus]|nr:hypothetical protein E2542_SST09115 [Spatholobus suberectus]